MSARPSRAHSAARARVSVSRRWARARSPATSRPERSWSRCRRVPGVGDPVEVALVEDDEAAGGVEDVGDGGILTKGVTHRTGEDHDQPGLVGEGRAGPGAWRRQPGVPSGPPWRTTSIASASGGSTCSQPASAARARSGRRVSRGPADVAVRPEQHPQPRLTVRSGRPAGDEGTGGHRGAALTGEMVSVTNRHRAAPAGMPLPGRAPAPSPGVAGRRSRRRGPACAAAAPGAPAPGRDRRRDPRPGPAGTPAAIAAVANRTATVEPSWSVSASAGWPCAAAR